jgi:microsomal dipeptidase-like Zn-dependent dipeptidase
VIADFHAHYAMHLIPDEAVWSVNFRRSRSGTGWLPDGLRFGLVRLGSRFANYRSFYSGPRVTVPLMRAGGVRVALSPLYRPFCEIDFTKRYGAPPDPSYFDALLRQLEMVEAHIAQDHADDACIAHDPEELERLLASDMVVVVHCVEGGFHLGGTPEAVDSAVTTLAQRGVAYVTLAHLFFRSVATNAPAIPFIPDRLYRAIFRQPDVGLTALGRAALRAMVRERVLVDLSHMDQQALDKTFELLDEIDPGQTVPVIATHSGYRFGRQSYNLDDATLKRIAERQGVVGLIMAEHQATDGLRTSRTRSFEESVQVICSHIDKIRDICGSHRHVGIGSDLDGYIKPTLAGIDDMSSMAGLEAKLVERYGDADASLIASGNLLRLLRTYWRKPATADA